MSWQKDFGDLWDGNATIRRTVYSVVAVALGYAFWARYEHQLKSVAIGVLILAAGLVEETTWYFWIILIGAYLWVNNNWKNARRQEKIIRLLSEIRDKLNSR